MHILVDALGPTIDTAGLLEGSVVVVVYVRRCPGGEERRCLSGGGEEMCKIFPIK
jgi:hypothetical protein